MTDNLRDAHCVQTPLLELLRGVPADARMIYEHSPTHSQSIPVGRLCHEAAAALSAAPAEGPTPDEQAAFEHWLEQESSFPQHMRDGYTAADVEHAEREAAYDAWHARASLAAQPPEPTPSVPPGWKLVPIEPTAEMFAAGLECSAKDSWAEVCAQLWFLMLAAAPETGS